MKLFIPEPRLTPDDVKQSDICCNYCGERLSVGDNYYDGTNDCICETCLREHSRYINEDDYEDKTILDKYLQACEDGTDDCEKFTATECSCCDKGLLYDELVFDLRGVIVCRDCIQRYSHPATCCEKYEYIYLCG